MLPFSSEKPVILAHSAALSSSDCSTLMRRREGGSFNCSSKHGTKQNNTNKTQQHVSELLAACGTRV